MARKAIFAAAVLLCCACAVLLVLPSTDDQQGEMVVLEPRLSSLASQGYLNWLRHSAKLNGGKTSESREFEEDAAPPLPDLGNMGRAGKLLLRLRKTISREKRVLSRLNTLMKERRGGKKQPESVVVHVGQIGEPGLRGKQGKEGARGADGKQGPTGARGAPGERGPRGRRGVQGRPGPVGRQGARGRRGRLGLPGLRGEDGPRGPTGPPGLRGYVGLPGPPGLQGPNGNEGPVGTLGVPGAPGPMGPLGAAGTPGRLILPQPSPPTYRLSGLVRNAVAGALITAGQVSASVGDRIISSSTISSGNYVLERLPSGRYTIRVSAAGFCDYEEELTIVNQHATFNINLSPSLQGLQLRIVLTWGAEPRDLDSHLRSPNNCLTYYANRNGCPGVSLDRDITNGFGPETMTIHVPQPGIYRYRVHNYSRTTANLMVNGLANQPATVTVYKGCQRTIFICGRDGNVDAATHFWDVFTYNGQTGAIARAIV